MKLSCCPFDHVWLDLDRARDLHVGGGSRWRSLRVLHRCRGRRFAGRLKLPVGFPETYGFRFARPRWHRILAVFMLSEDDFQYAIENTQVILEPAGQIASFGHTSFRFYLISELMDQVNEVRVRDGRIHAERPQILTPEHYCRLLLEGFGDKAQKYIEQFREPRGTRPWFATDFSFARRTSRKKGP